MLTMRETPKISDRPAPTKNRPEADASPLSAWNRKASNDISADRELRFASPTEEGGRAKHARLRDQGQSTELDPLIQPSSFIRAFTPVFDGLWSRAPRRRSNHAI